MPEDDVIGTAARVPDGSGLLGCGAVVVWNDVVPEGREQFYRWHDKEHVPERLAIAGFRRGRRYVRPGHSPEWLTVYEADDVDVLTSPAYLARLNAPTTLTQQTLRFFRNTSRAVCRLVHSSGTSSGGHVLAMRIDVPPRQGAAFVAAMRDRVFPRALEVPGLVACHLLAADRDASYIDTAESRTRTFDVPAWVLLAEATRAAAAESFGDRLAGTELPPLGAGVRDTGVYALELVRLPGPARPL